MSNKRKFKIDDKAYMRKAYITADGQEVKNGSCLKVVEVFDDGTYGCIPFSTPSFAHINPFRIPQGLLSAK